MLVYWSFHYFVSTHTWWPMIYLVTHVFATGVINDPVEFAIFAYVDTWEGWVGGLG